MTDTLTEPAFYVGEGEDGIWVAYRETAEPVFCLPGASEDEAVALGIKTFEEYQELFLERKIRAVRHQTGAQPAPLRHSKIRSARGYQLEVA